MVKIFLSVIILCVLSIFVFKLNALAEEIHFANNIYVLKYSAVSPITKGYENEYFLKNETKKDFTKMIVVYHYPNIDKPLKYAQDVSKKVESEETDILLKLVQNKKEDKAAFSYLENGSINGKKYFEYNIFKFEKHPTKGMLALRYAIRYFFANDEDIAKIGNNIREHNDEYLQQIISSPMPQIVEKEVSK